MRILGVTLPDNKRMEIALTALYGVGRPRAQYILKGAGVDFGKKAPAVTEAEETAIRKIVEKKKKRRKKKKTKKQKKNPPPTAGGAKKVSFVNKKFERGVLHIQSTYNNTMLTLADEGGNAVFFSSSGALGFKGAKKGTPF